MRAPDDTPSASATPSAALCTLAPAGLAVPAPLVEALRAAYGEPGRAYHDNQHLDEVLARFAEASRDVGFRQPREVFVALLFHDAIYVPGAHDNERRSAALALRALEGELSGQGLDAERVRALIELTARHGAIEEPELASDPDAALFLDCDLAILAADAERFAAYERGIAAEYASIPADAYSAGRRAFLRRMLEKPRIFLSAWGQARFEPPARANLARALAGA